MIFHFKLTNEACELLNSFWLSDVLVNVCLAALAVVYHRQAVPLIGKELSLLLSHGAFEQKSHVELHSGQASDVQLLFKVVHDVLL